VERYYTGKLRRYGACALGVDWACEPTQQLRFVQLLKLCRSRLPFSINDLGCGYGALVPFLRKRRPGLIAAYYGVDLSTEMVEAARRSNSAETYAEFAVGGELQRVADYSVASGVFNVKLAHPLQVWESFVRRTLTDLHNNSARGFAVNFLRPLDDGIVPKQLYCTQAEPWVRYCQRELGCDVEVSSNYGLKEFTLIARRSRRGA
jgi:SAM-dependent methyltransferase